MPQTPDLSPEQASRRFQQWDVARRVSRGELSLARLEAKTSLNMVEQDFKAMLTDRLGDARAQLTPEGVAMLGHASRLEAALIERENVLQETDLAEFSEAVQRWSNEFEGITSVSDHRECFKDEDNAEVWEGIKASMLGGNVQEAVDGLATLMSIVLNDLLYMRNMPALPDLRPPDPDPDPS